ncbi:MAG: hormogonium polysaccharide biosynthesis protein HpsL [Spirulinaceae cyanobacterium]
MVKTKSKKKSPGGKNNQPILSREESIAQQRKAKQAKQKLIKTIFTGLGIGILFGMPAMAAVSPIIGLGVMLAIPTLLFCYAYPSLGLWLFLIYLPFSGTVTYWIGGGNALFSLAKDAFYIPALFGMLREYKRKRERLPIPKNLTLTFSLSLVLAVMTLLLVNGSLQLAGSGEGVPFLQGVLGLKVLLGYVPLIVCAIYLIKTKKELLICTRLHLILAIICCVLGVMQYLMLDSGTCVGTRNAVGEELFKATVEAKCLVGGSVAFAPSQDMIRLPGTFPSPWHWAWFLIANSVLTYTVAFGDPSFFWRMGGIAGMVLVFANAVVSGQRIALALVPVVTIILLVLTGQLANLKRFIPIGGLLALALVFAISKNPDIVQERIDSFQSRAEASPPQAFIEEQFRWAFESSEGFLGMGLGRATNSTRVFGKVSLVETYYPKLIYEMGLLATLAFLFFLTNIVYVGFKNYRAVRDKNLRSLGSSLWVFVLIISYNTYWYPLDTEPVNVYYWFFAGVILRLGEINRQEEEKRIEAEENDPILQKKLRRKLKKKQTA